MTAKNMPKNCLPTPCSQPQSWGEREISPLTLRAAEPLGGKQDSTGKRRPSGAWLARLSSFTRQITLLVFVALLSVGGYYLVSRYVATTVIVQGRSMMPTLQDGDRLILNRWSYFHRSPHRGDVVVVKDPGHDDYAVKRIVGLPSDQILFRRGAILVNGKYLVEPYLASGTQTYLPDSHEKLLIVGKNRYFLLGDNRGNSEDSRYYGAVPRSLIVGAISR